jgi:hypothetical protein
VTDTLPRARQHAAALAVAARTDDGARAALLDFLDEHSDDPELRDRAELVRLEGEQAGRAEGWPDARKEIRRRVMAGELSHAAAAILLATADTRPDPLAARIAVLQSRLSAWPCPKCEKGRPGWKRITRRDYSWHKPKDYQRPRIRIKCLACDGTGDVLRGVTLAWDCGYPRWYALLTVADAVGVSWRYRDDVAFVRHLPGPEYRPTHRLRVLAGETPWGVPLEGVRVWDRRPYQFRGEGDLLPWCWDYQGDDPNAIATGKHLIPKCIYDRIDGKKTGNGIVSYPTESAAVDALARALVTFARECP